MHFSTVRCGSVRCGAVRCGAKQNSAERYNKTHGMCECCAAPHLAWARSLAQGTYTNFSSPGAPARSCSLCPGSPPACPSVGVSGLVLGLVLVFIICGIECCIAMYCIVLYCIAMYCFAHCGTLSCTKTQTAQHLYPFPYPYSITSHTLVQAKAGSQSSHGCIHNTHYNTHYTHNTTLHTHYTHYTHYTHTTHTTHTLQHTTHHTQHTPIPIPIPHLAHVGPG
jgi:hypothetical protein